MRWRVSQFYYETHSPLLMCHPEPVEGISVCAKDLRSFDKLRMTAGDLQNDSRGSQDDSRGCPG
jgi:hypothetical protein